MRAYILTSFCLGIIALIIKLVELGIYKWPHERTPLSMGEHISVAIFSFGFVIWAGIVLWL